MKSNEIPPMESIAPIVDRMRDLAMDELPAPRTCKIELWDDGTFEIVIYHNMGMDERQWLHYERTTGEILWKHVQGAHWASVSLTGDETIHEPVYEESDVRVVATVEPPFN